MPWEAGEADCMQNTLDTESCRGNGKVASCLTFHREGVLPQDFSHSSTFVSFFILCVGRERRCVCECRCPQRPECQSPPGAGLTGSYRPPEVGASGELRSTLSHLQPSIQPSASHSLEGCSFMESQSSLCVFLLIFFLLNRSRNMS